MFYPIFILRDFILRNSQKMKDNGRVIPDCDIIFYRGWSAIGVLIMYYGWGETNQSQLKIWNCTLSY